MKTLTAPMISISVGCLSAYKKILYHHQGSGSETVCARKFSSTKDPPSIRGSTKFCDPHMSDRRAAALSHAAS